MQKLQVTLEGRPVALEVRRHRRARRISLRLSAGHDAVIMTLPLRASVDSGMEFFLSKKQWVLENVVGDGAVAFADGAILPVLGREVIIVRLDGRGISALENDRLLIYGAAEFTARRVKDLLKKLLREECFARAQSAAKRIGGTVKAVNLRDTSSRWGSCSRVGTLTFSWRLVFAPLHVLDYLIAHEVAHLKEMNHGPRFWELVDQLHPQAKAARLWLKNHGHQLHRYG